MMWASVKDNFLQALNISWKGMLAVFIVIAVIIVMTVLLNWSVNKLGPVVKARAQASREKKRQKKELSEEQSAAEELNDRK